MIIRPLDPEPATGTEFLPAWPVVQRIQKQKYESCWLITQPSHAALAGALAAALSGPQLPQPDAKLIQAIALHDAGWGMPDAQIIQMSRADSRYRPASFLETSVPEFLSAWTKSIEVGQSVSPAGGYVVSRHFYRLAEHRLHLPQDRKTDRQNLQSFLNSEARREKKLAALQDLTLPDLERLTGLLQLCDLLSLYLCCGAQDRVVLPSYFGIQLRLTPGPDGIYLDPPMIAPKTRFSFAALRCPATEQVSGCQMDVNIL